jgi:hypothetical protein
MVERVKECGLSVFQRLVRGSIYGVGRRDEVGWKGEVVISLLSI